MVGQCYDILIEVVFKARTWNVQLFTRCLTMIRVMEAWYTFILFGLLLCRMVHLSVCRHY